MRIPDRTNGVKARLWGAVWAFVICRKAGAMLVGGGLAMLVLASVGGMLTNYAWREAQEAEVQAALRAGVSASAHFMRGDLAKSKDKIQERVAGVMRGLLDNLIIHKNDIVIEHDFSTNRTVVKVGGHATYIFRSLWAAGGTGDPESLREQVTVEFQASQFEFALALDLSVSMNDTPTDWSVTKLQALKNAITTIGTTIDGLSTTNPGIAALALVPFSNVVNVSDTSGTEKTDAKERYVRMLTGADYDTQASRDTTGHWVDTFHSYGTGADMGALASRSLPDFLSATDWNLHQSGTEDISTQRPEAGTWSFEGEDFWNGCVMARWGAYWDSAARPTEWDASNTSNWPAKKTVAGWEPGSAGITDLPLHLSDAPPDASDPNTRFTAYSWPDGRINGLADGRLLEAMRTTLRDDYTPFGFYGMSENRWDLRPIDRGGSLYCPEAPLVPLTDNLTALQAANDYKTTRLHSKGGYGQTFLHLGIVWGLRTLSPLWRDVWNTRVSGHDVPRTPCSDGATTKEGCSSFVEKAIVIVSDGTNEIGRPGRGRIFGGSTLGSVITSNPELYSWCPESFTTANAFEEALSFDDPSSFAGKFDVDENGLFTADGLSAVLDGFQATHPTTSALDPNTPAGQLLINVYRSAWGNAIKAMTPWQLYWGYDKDSPTKETDATDVLVKSSNLFSFSGRPVRNGLACRPATAFSAYGRPEDLVRVGDALPVSGVAPFSVSSWDWTSLTADLEDPLEARLNDWFLEACDIAGQRGVRIHAIYIGDDPEDDDKSNQANIARAAISLFEECVDRGYGGKADVDEVHVAPTSQALTDAIEGIMDIRRTLRFLDT